MRDNLIKILQDMGRVAFTNEEKADYLMQHDVVPVVRCKDCKFADPYMTYNKRDKNICNILGISSLSPYDYCSFGERRTE